MSTIFVSRGAQEYAGGTITETTGKDITAATITMCLGTYDAPGTFVAPTVDSSPTVASRLVKLLVTNTTTVGAYWVWVKVGDGPETVVLRLGEQIVA